jgi:diguanylate cyclase (GGDEF)-like protein
MRRFNERPISAAWVVAGLALWIAVDLLMPAAYHPASAAFGFVPEVAYLAASAYELWRTREELLRGRYGLIAVLSLHLVTLASGTFDILSGVMPANELPRLNSWFGIINFESLLYSMASAVFMVLLTKERSERHYAVAAREDALTGIANRRALLDAGERLLRRCQLDGRSFSLIMFDLDHFKEVNDTFGHAAGDSVLQAFAAAVQSTLRPADVFGRYGGEEFIALLPGATIEAAQVIAERVRNSFAQLAMLAADRKIHATVSAGVASATSSALTLEAIIRIADGALYRAKELGRNRVERAAPDKGSASASGAMRVA